MFLFDGLTYLMLIFILSKINLRQIQRRTDLMGQSRWEALKDGFRYIRSTPSINSKVMQLMLTISLMIPLMIVVFRTYVQDKFGLSAEEFGFVFTLPALGSMMGALSFTIVKPQKPIKALWFGVPALIVGSVLVPQASTAFSASLIMAFTGFCMYLSLASITVSLHLSVEEEFRGRLGSVIGLGFTSLGPMMGLPLGSFADHFGFDPAIYSIAGAFLLGSAALALLHFRQRKKADILRLGFEGESMSNVQVFYEATPNPQSMKFIVTETIAEESLNIPDFQAAYRSPLAQKLFGFPWTAGVYIGPNFVTISKQDWVEWETLAEPLSELIREHIENREPVLIQASADQTPESGIEENDSETVKLIKTVLNTEIRPAVAMDGGDILFHKYEDQILYLHMQGACSGCPSSTMTLKQGIEVRLKEVVPEIQEVVAI